MAQLEGVSAVSAVNPYRAYPVLLSVSEAASLLNDAADVHATDIGTITASEEHGGSGLVIELEAGRTPVTLIYTSEGMRLSQADHRTLANLSRERRQHQQRHREMVGADVETLRQYWLPLYWNHEWRAEKYAETGSFNAVARKYKREVQGALGSSIYRFDRKFSDGVRLAEPASIRRRTRRDDFVDYYEVNQGRITQAAMAEHFRVTDSTISRWIRELTRIYRELTDGRQRLSDEADLVEFSGEHNIDPAIIKRWVDKGSVAFGEEPVQQPKTKYYTHDEYERLFRQFEELYRQAGGQINQSAVARELNVDRSTIRQWMRRLVEPSAYAPPSPD